MTRVRRYAVVVLVIPWCAETVLPYSGFRTENRFPFPPPVRIIAMDNGREGLKGHREYQDLLKTTVQRFSAEKSFGARSSLPD